jgi:PAS domain-containing protein
MVDDDDFEAVMAVGSWAVSDCGGHLYASHSYVDQFGITRSIRLHTFLTRWTLVDHRNGNGLDNRRENIRPALPRENSANQRLSTANSSGFKGVTLYKRTGRWRAHIAAGGRHMHIGYFTTPEEAARAYDERASELFGEFANLNFARESAA